MGTQILAASDDEALLIFNPPGLPGARLSLPVLWNQLTAAEQLSFVSTPANMLILVRLIIRAIEVGGMIPATDSVVSAQMAAAVTAGLLTQVRATQIINPNVVSIDPTTVVG